MSNGRMLSLVLLVIGVALLVWGLNASDSLSSELSEAFQGAPSNKAIFLVAGGALVGIVGLIGLVRPARR